jgi:hypothetical protein
MSTPLHSPDRSRDKGPDDRGNDVDDVREVRERRLDLRLRDPRLAGDRGVARDDAPISPVGRPFPSVGGTALSGENVRFPGDLAGAPAVLLVAYQRMAQSDVSSWLEFLEARQPGLVVYEVPTIPAVAFRPWASWIDGGMRKGVPQELWPRVVTLYRDGGPVRELLGDSGFVGASVVLLDAAGVVRWFDAQGFTPDKGESLLSELRRLGDAPPD